MESVGHILNLRIFQRVLCPDFLYLLKGESGKLVMIKEEEEEEEESDERNSRSLAHEKRVQLLSCVPGPAGSPPASVEWGAA